MQPRLKTRIALRPTRSKQLPFMSSGRIESQKSKIVSPIDNSLPFSIERVFYILRWIVIGLALMLQLYVVVDSKTPEPLVRALQLTSMVAVSTGFTSFMRSRMRTVNARIILSTLDAAIIALAIGLSGGIYSPFLVLVYLVVVEASFFFTAGSALPFTALVGVMFVTATLFINRQTWDELHLTIVMSEVMAMFVFVSVGSSMMRALEQQREVARREKALSAQLNHQVKALTALNRLSERLNASLELEDLMQKTVESLPAALEVDACVAFLTNLTSEGEWGVTSAWYGVDEAYEPVEQDTREGIQAGPLVLSHAELMAVIEEGRSLQLQQENGQEAILIVPLRWSDQESGALALMRQNGPAFDESDQALLSALGRQMSLLIRNARLYDLERQNVARLQELEQLKSDFLSVVSHELRTPLTSIKASTILLLSRPVDDMSEAEAKLLRNVDRNTDRLSSLVSDLLDMTKLQNGRLKLSLLPVSMEEIMLDVVATMRPLTDRKQQSLQAEITPKLPSVLGDRRRIEQILTNLISNANRYTQAGGSITVKIGQEAGKLQVSVADNGPGIELREQELIFERFYRATSNQSSKTGTGLGLSIARSLVELHGGRIWVESKPGQGSTFYFTLPLQSQAEQRLLTGTRVGTN